jgi:hypothetical protein
MLTLPAVVGREKGGVTIFTQLKWRFLYVVDCSAIAITLSTAAPPVLAAAVTGSTVML